MQRHRTHALYLIFHALSPYSKRHHVIRKNAWPMAGALGRNYTRQRIHCLLRPQPAFSTWSQFNRRVDDMAKGLIAIGVERGTHVGIYGKCAGLADPAVRLRQNRRRLRNGKHQLQTSRTGIPVRELGYAHALHRQRRKRQRLQADDHNMPELKTCQRGHLKSERFPT